ncbi:OLC1v1030913C1 [Oldenlandia corymbosa var. corymbosa]|uniref:OLC1v1030913C1 n=1 Tax=Oldenlandia corymbosa var. corymbosa TaxID=529605 RepID=A0AAV1CHZ2_OLDCO|nr:OLC1v1030913C1 [Oldenlandia corymbosa var. corymbosa]
MPKPQRELTMNKDYVKKKPKTIEKVARRMRKIVISCEDKDATDSSSDEKEMNPKKPKRFVRAVFIPILDVKVKSSSQESNGKEKTPPSPISKVKKEKKSLTEPLIEIPAMGYLYPLEKCSNVVVGENISSSLTVSQPPQNQNETSESLVSHTSPSSVDISDDGDDKANDDVGLGSIFGDEKVPDLLLMLDENNDLSLDEIAQGLELDFGLNSFLAGDYEYGEALEDFMFHDDAFDDIDTYGFEDDAECVPPLPDYDFGSDFGVFDEEGLCWMNEVPVHHLCTINTVWPF